MCIRGRVSPEANPDKNSESLNIHEMSVKMTRMEVTMKRRQQTDRDLILLQWSSQGSTRVLERAPNSCMCRGSETREALALVSETRRKLSWVSVLERPETTWSSRTLEITTTWKLVTLKREGKFAAQFADDPESDWGPIICNRGTISGTIGVKFNFHYENHNWYFG